PHGPGELGFQVAPEVAGPFDGRHEQHHGQPAVAGEGVAEFAPGEPHGGGVAPVALRVLVVRVVAGPPVGVGEAWLFGADEPGDGGAPPVGADDEVGPDVVLAAAAFGDADADGAAVLPQQAGDAVSFAYLGPGVAGGVDE